MTMHFSQLNHEMRVKGAELFMHSMHLLALLGSWRNFHENFENMHLWPLNKARKAKGKHGKWMGVKKHNYTTEWMQMGVVERVLTS